MKKNDIVIDAHQDLAYNTLAYGRDYRLSAMTIREKERRSPVSAANGQALIGLPELLAGRVAVVFGTIYTMPAHRMLSDLDIVYTDPSQAHDQAMAQLDVYQRWSDEEPEFELVGTKVDLSRVLETWTTEPENEAPLSSRIGIVPLMENAEPIQEPAELELWVERGIRIVGPAWVSNRYTGGAGEPGPLTDLGRELLEVMAELNVGLDLSHMADQAALEALDRFEGVLMATHSNPRSIVPGDRQLSDAIIEGIAERDGVIGIAPYNGFLRQDWHPRDRKGRVTLVDVVRAIDYVCQRVGSADHVALGSDFDGEALTMWPWGVTLTAALAANRCQQRSIPLPICQRSKRF
jgi:membrane dipeptidase